MLTKKVFFKFYQIPSYIYENGVGLKVNAFSKNDTIIPYRILLSQ